MELSVLWYKDCTHTVTVHYSVSCDNDVIMWWQQAFGWIYLYFLCARVWCVDSKEEKWVRNAADAGDNRHRTFVPRSFRSNWPFSPSSSSTFCFSCFTSWSKSCRKRPNTDFYSTGSSSTSCCSVYWHASVILSREANMRVFTHVLTTSAVKKIPQSWTGTGVNTANITILRTDTTACSYQRPPKGRIGGPDWAWSGPASIPGWRYTLLLSRDPSTWSALEESSFVSRGREPLPCRYTTSNQTKRTSPGSEHAHFTELNTTYLGTYALVSPCRIVRGHIEFTWEQDHSWPLFTNGWNPKWIYFWLRWCSWDGDAALGRTRLKQGS